MSVPELADASVLVTGGAGFIGSHLVDSLLERGARVTVLDSFVTGRAGNLARWLREEELAELEAGTSAPHLVVASTFPLRIVRGDIRDAVACRLGCGLEGRGVPRARFVLHQAALGSVPRSLTDPATTIDVNVAGTATVLAAARDAGAERVVWASSSSVYGDSDRLPKREGEEGRPLSPYALSKRMCEQLAETFGRCFDLPSIGLRYFNIYGPRQDPEGPYAAVLPRFFAAALAGEAPLIHGDGEQSRDFTYVADAVAANLNALGAPAAACGRAYNVAPGSRTTVNQLAAAVRAIAGGPEPRHGPARPGDVRHSAADPTAAREALGFTAEIELAEGLEHAAVYYRELFGAV